ncbi:Fc.00g115360.m01.CDS01 [Cosmosporella sp. VM-42]
MADDIKFEDAIELESSPSNEHQQYLLERHGTTDLDPMPRMSDDDPLNWPKWKKNTNLALVSFHSMMATFTAASIQCAFVDIAADLNVSVHKASYLSSLVIAVLGVGPLIWRPLSQVYGRRPIFLISLIFSAVGNVGCALSHSFNAQAVCRAITAFFICPAAALGSAVVHECFFRKERAQKIGIWTIMVTLGVPVAPFIFGFVALRVGYRWIYWTLAITNGVQFILQLFFGPETRFVPINNLNHRQNFSSQRGYLNIRRIDPTPFTASAFIHPLSYFLSPNVFIAAAAYSMVFLFGSVMPTFEIPQLFPEKFDFNTQQVGLQNIGIIIGTGIGESIGGRISDRWMLRREKKKELKPQPEFRLWISYVGYALTICGVVVFLVQTAHASNHWNVTPIVGAGIAAAGNQLVTTVMVTYSVDCYSSDAAAVGVFITFVRQIWGFVGPFWFPVMIDELGLLKTAGVMSAMIVGISILPTMILQWKGLVWRN